MNINAINGDVVSVKTSALIVNLFEGVSLPGGATGAVDKALGGTISKLINEGEIRGVKGEITLIHTMGKLPSDRIIVAGLGKQEKFSTDVIRHVIGIAVRFVTQLNVDKVTTIAHGAGIGGIDARECGEAIAEGAYLGSYSFRKYKSLKDDDKRHDIDEISVVEIDGSKVSDIQHGLYSGRILAESTNLARDMANEPANVLTPTAMAEWARIVASETDLEFEVFEKPQMVEMGMGALLSVAAGSDQPPKLIVLRYHGDRENESNSLALCGKGITFDSGGISIKPAEGMGAMKGDMAGGAAVIGAMKAIALMKPKINVMAVIPATENMSGGSASRPGDIVRAISGKTIEIDNTDAEGRLVLADAIGYARKYQPRRIVDVATLTGAAVIALGNTTSLVMGNDQKMVDRVIKAGEYAGEKFWQLPMFEEYRNLIDSKVADIKNSGGRPAGSITGGYFIKEFVEEVPWAHLDIAGTSRTDKTNGYIVTGATGVPVRTLVHMVFDMANDPN